MRARVGGTALVPALIAAWLLALAPSAHAHAELMGTTPPDGAVLKRQPELVTFHFGEPVEAGLGAVRVMDARGRRADDGSLVHPRAGTSDIGTRLRPGLPQGTYTTSYRVVSDDGHVVSGSSSFSVGRRSAEAAAPAGRGMTGHRRARPAESVAFGVARGATYLATALIVGLLAFLRIAWLPALDSAAGSAPSWADASGAFARRARTILYASIQLGVVAGVAGLALEGATVTGTSVWGALQDHVFREVTRTNFGGYWAFRVAALVTLGAVLVLSQRDAVVPQLRRAALGADGVALPRAGVGAVLTVGLPASVLVLVPGLTGHAADHLPGVMVPVDVVHVLAMSLWLGGLAGLLLAVPVATRRLAAPDGHRLLAAVTVRFSAVALAAVVLLVATGWIQAFVHVGSWSALVQTGYGRAVLAKIGLTLALVCLGAINRRRAIPALRRLARGEETGTRPSRLLARAMAAEVVLVVAVLGVTSALVSYAPPA